MVELLFILYAHICKKNNTEIMCGSLAGRDVEGMIYLNWQTNQTKPFQTTNSLRQQWPVGPVGRVGTVSVERNRQRPPPPPKFTQAHEKEVQRASYDSESLNLGRLANDNRYFERN